MWRNYIAQIYLLSTKVFLGMLVDTGNQRRNSGRRRAVLIWGQLSQRGRTSISARSHIAPVVKCLLSMHLGRPPLSAITIRLRAEVFTTSESRGALAHLADVYFTSAG